MCLLWVPLFIHTTFPTQPLMAIILCISAFYYSTYISQHPSLYSQKIEGVAFFHPAELTLKHSLMGRQWSYKGMISQFNSHDGSQNFYNISAKIQIPATKEISRPHAGQSYQIQGKLKQTNIGNYILLPDKDRAWIPLNKTWNVTELRYLAKKSVNQYIKSKIQEEPSKSFLNGIANGDFENRLLNFEFSRFGLQHIMAISGFHFSIVASMLGFFLSRIFGQKLSLVFLVVLLTLYFLFLGNSPSIIRAWLSCMITCAALLFEKPASALNSLGIGLLVILIIDPESANHLGFQFSFMVTASILLFFSPIDNQLQFFFPKRHFQTAIEMTSTNQYGIIILALLRQALALSMSVNIVAIPLSLLYFEKFPIMSILYNFFFPWLVSLSMLFLILGMAFDLIWSSLASIIHQTNEAYTQFILGYTHQMPRSIDLYINRSLSADTVILLIGVFFTLGIFVREKLMPEEQGNEIYL